MTTSRRKIVADLWVTTPLTLSEFCEKLQIALGIQSFDFDAENVWEWGIVYIEDGRIEINVPSAYDEGEPMPDECLRLMTLTRNADSASGIQDDLIRGLVPKFGQAIANFTQIEMYSGLVEYLNGDDFDYRIEQVFRPQIG